MNVRHTANYCWFPLLDWTRMQVCLKWTPLCRHLWPCLWRSGAPSPRLWRVITISCSPWSCTAASPSAAATTPPTSACQIWKIGSSGCGTEKKRRRSSERRRKIKRAHGWKTKHWTMMTERCHSAWMQGEVQVWLVAKQEARSCQRVGSDSWGARGVCLVMTLATAAAHIQRKPPTMDQQRDPNGERPSTAWATIMKRDLKRSLE